MENEKEVYLIEDLTGRLCLGTKCNKLAWVTFTDEDALQFETVKEAQDWINKQDRAVQLSVSYEPKLHIYL
jgi:hypothetical protein